MSEEVKQLKRRIEQLQSQNSSLQRQLNDKNKTGRRLENDVWDNIINRIQDTDYIASLISNGALTVYDESDNKQTLLHISAKYGNYEVVQLCLNLGSDLQKKDYWGKKPLDLARQSGFYHVEQLLLFSRMKSNVGKRVADTAFDIRKQDGINENILNQLALYKNVQRKKLFKDTLIDLMINIINKKLSFSDDLLSLCWEFAAEANSNVLSSNLWKSISKTCTDVIENGNKRDWFWLKTFFIPSTIWYKNINYQQIEKEKAAKNNENKSEAKDKENETKDQSKYKINKRPKDDSSDDDNDNKIEQTVTIKKKKDYALRCICGISLSLMDVADSYGLNMSINCDLCKQKVYTEKVWHCSYEQTSVHSGGYDLCLDCARKQKCYLYFELLKLVNNKATVQLNELKQKLNILSMEQKDDWKELIEWDIPDEYDVARQDAIPNGVEPKFTYSELLAQSSANFKSHKFYDYNEYLCELILLAQMVDNNFQKSVQQIFGIDKDTNRGIIKDFDEDGTTTGDVEGTVYYMRGPVKLIYRAKSKAENDYSSEKFPTSACVLDLNRCSLVFDNISSLLSGLQLFANKVKYYQSGNIIGIVRDKNGFKEYVIETQYADIKLNVLIKGKKNNIVGEVQFLLQTMLDFKNKAHNLYAIQRQKDYVENSVASILPMLLDEEKQIFVSGCMGDVKTLLEIMVNDNKTAKDIMKVDSKTGNSILHRICTLGISKAFLFLRSLLSINSFMHHLFKANDSDQKPIEYSVRYCSLAIAKDLFTMKKVKEKYENDENECFRLIFWLFAVCLDNELKTFILSELSLFLNARKICKYLSNYRMKKPQYKLSEGHWELYNYTILSRSVLHTNLSNYKYLISIIGEKEFISGILFGNIWDINAIENAIQYKKIDFIKYFLSLSQLKFKWMYDFNELFRIVYWTFMRAPTDEIKQLLIDEIKNIQNILKDNIPKLLNGYLRNFIIDSQFPQPVKEICFKYYGNKTLAKLLDFHYKKDENEKTLEFASNAYKYDNYTLFGSIMNEKYLDTFQQFTKLFTEKEIINGLFINDKWNQNTFEKAIEWTKSNYIDYFLSLKGIKEKIINNNKILFRIIYWIYLKFNANITNKIFKFLDLNQDKLNELKEFKYEKDENINIKFDDKAFTYYDKILPDHVFGIQSNEKNCPGYHGLKKFNTPSDGYGCDICSKRMGNNSEMYGCRICNYDVCCDCFGSSKDDDEKEEINCAQNHGLIEFSTPHAGYGCDVCSKPVNSGAKMYGCRKCNYDVCENCFNQK